MKKTKKNIKYKKGGVLSKCKHSTSIEPRQGEIVNPDLDDSIIEQIDSIDVSKKIDILHITIGGTCRGDIPKEYMSYHKECVNARYVAKEYTDNYFVINIDPEINREKITNQLDLKYYHSQEKDCVYNLKLKELIKKVLKRKNSIVIIDNNVFLYIRGMTALQSFLKPFAKYEETRKSILGKRGKFQTEFKSVDIPVVDNSFFEIDSPQERNRIIFSNYIKPIILERLYSFNDPIGPKFLMEYYLHICKDNKDKINKTTFRNFLRNNKNIDTLNMKYIDVLRLLIETKFIELEIPFRSKIFSRHLRNTDVRYITENYSNFCSI